MALGFAPPASGSASPVVPAILVRDRWVPEDLAARIRGYHPKTELGRIVRDCLNYLPAEQASDLLERITAAVVVESSLALVHFHAGPELRIDDYGIVSRKVVTDNGVAGIVDALDNTVANQDWRYHGIGTGTNAEAAADTALQTELTTQYNPNNTRATGTFSQPSANISQSQATNTVDASAAVTEHGVFTQAATGGGVLLDRSVFSVINLASGDSLQSTYQLTLTSGG